MQERGAEMVSAFIPLPQRVWRAAQGPPKHTWSAAKWPCSPPAHTGLSHPEGRRTKSLQFQRPPPQPAEMGAPHFHIRTGWRRDVACTKGPCKRDQSDVSHRDRTALLPRGQDPRQNRCLTHAGISTAGLALLFSRVFKKCPFESSAAGSALPLGCWHAATL